LSLDEPNNEDDTITIGDFSFCMNKELVTQIKSATIDLTYMGFTIEPEIPLVASGSACGSCASSCSS